MSCIYITVPARSYTRAGANSVKIGSSPKVNTHMLSCLRIGSRLLISVALALCLIAPACLAVEVAGPPAPVAPVTPPATLVSGPPAPAPPAAAAPAAAATPATPAPPPPPEQTLEITTNEQGISVYAISVQADELLTKLARETGVGVIIDDTVGRRDNGKFTSRLLTVNLTNKKISEIIEKICTAYGLSYSNAGGVFMISEGIPRNPSSYLMSDIDSVTTEYVVSKQAKSLLPVFLQDHVKVNEGQNAVILSGPKEVLAKFREDVKQFDVPAAEIMIDVIMLELTNSASKELGFDWVWNNNRNGVNISPGIGDLTFRSFGGITEVFTATLSALVANGQAHVNANPRIATVSGQTASIFVGRQRYLSQSVDGQNYIDAGITLSMTPWTGGNGEIIAEIHPEVSVMSAFDPVTKLPEKSTRRANTSVRVKDGETIVIGGLNQTEQSRTRTRIPVLGQIPLLGWMFTKTERSEAQTEMVFLITPRIMSKTGHLSPEREKELLEPLGVDLTGSR